METSDWILLVTLVIVTLTFLYTFVITQSFATVSLCRGLEQEYHLIINNLGKTAIPVVSIDIVAVGEPGFLFTKSKLDKLLKTEHEASLYQTTLGPYIIPAGEAYNLEITDGNFFSEELNLANVLVENARIYLVVTYISNRGNLRTTGILLLKSFNHEYQNFGALKEYLIENIEDYTSGTLTYQWRFF